VKPTSRDKAYFAGFFDGEGSVMLGLNQSGGLRLGVSCSQNTKNVMDMFENFFGGHVYSYTPTGRTSLIYQWRANGKVAYDFCIIMQDLLIVKLYVCMEAIETYEVKDDKPLMRSLVKAHKAHLKEERYARNRKKDN